jgi:hypothetical protein
MLPQTARKNLHFILIISTLLIVNLACRIPEITPPQPTSTDSDLTQEPPTGLTETTEPGAPDLTPAQSLAVPDIILTEVAASIYTTITAAAGTAETEITSEAPPDVESKPTLTPTSTMPPTLTPTATRTTQPTIPVSSSNTPTITATLIGYTPIPPEIGVWATPYFRIRNLNLHECGLNYAANFRIYNTSSVPLESLSLKFYDRTTSSILYGPATNNAPFLSTDRTCDSVGIDFLAPRQTMYAGNLLGPKTLQAHTIRANIKLCTKEDLAGICSEAIVEFVVP